MELATTHTSLTKWPSSVLIHLDSFELISALATQLVRKSFFKVCYNPVAMSLADFSGVCLLPFNNNARSLSMSEIMYFVKLDCLILLQDQLALLLEELSNPIAIMSQYLTLKTNGNTKCS